MLFKHREAIVVDWRWNLRAERK